jgi:hypothetical protein
MAKRKSTKEQTTICKTYAMACFVWFYIPVVPDKVLYLSQTLPGPLFIHDLSPGW